MTQTVQRKGSRPLQLRWRPARRWRPPPRWLNEKSITQRELLPKSRDCALTWVTPLKPSRSRIERRKKSAVGTAHVHNPILRRKTMNSRAVGFYSAGLYFFFECDF